MGSKASLIKCVCVCVRTHRGGDAAKTLYLIYFQKIQRREKMLMFSPVNPSVFGRVSGVLEKRQHGQQCDATARGQTQCSTQRIMSPSQLTSLALCFGKKSTPVEK